MIIKQSCKFCSKTTDLVSELDLGSSGKMLIFKCGHSYVESSLSSHVKEETKETKEKSLYEQLKEAVPEFCEVHQRNCIKTITSRSGKHLFPYQRDGVIAAFKNNAKFIWNDEMGLGKTIQGLVTLLLDEKELLPAIFVCKSIAKTNWLWETMDVLGIAAQVMYSSSETPWDMFKIHIISFDMMNRLDKMFKFSDIKSRIECPECKFICDEGQRNLQVGSDCPNCSGVKTSFGDTKREVVETNDGEIVTKLISEQFATQFKEIPKLIQHHESFPLIGSSLKEQNKNAWIQTIKRCKTIILDEVHLLKNPESQRSKALKTVCSLIPHKLCMSGTLIKNNATEYFVPLNIVKPEKYWRYASFCNTHVRLESVRSVTGNYVNKYTGLIDPSGFMKSVADCMIRRTTDDVLPDLPKLFKQQKYVELDEAFQKIYDKSEKNFAEWFDEASAMEIRTNLLAQLALLRHQTSLAKIDFTIDLALEFILATDRKLAIFTHHIDSREFLADRMITFFRNVNDPGCKQFSTDSVVRVLTQGKDVQQEIETFQNSPTERIIILSTLSHGESINLQFMSDCILHERQWNPANEDQAISGRFRRIGQEAKSIGCMIPTALGTIDEYFVELVERKRAISKELDTGEVNGYSEGFVRDLAEKIAERGRSKWKL